MILALNTSTRQCSTALLRMDRTVVAENLMCEGKGHFGGLMPAVDLLLTGSGVKPKDIKCVAVATGPGSFTGLRVGLSLAKGFCQALHIPVIGISSLRALAFQLPFAPHPIAPLLSSRKGEVFTALFFWNRENELQRKEKDNCFKLDHLPSLFTETTIFIGNDFSNQGNLLKEWVGSHAKIAPPQCWQLNASSVGALALARLDAGDIDDPVTLIPRYYRPPDIRSKPGLPNSR
ncbi:MAG: tRNA (adenosine(37)-N6)-threonylcarbamoyltransferase complex dimerization subunit type 1 TsaB [Deltaproteobacteria bacterium]|jgi:tRNA threonylcarbamoyladenosine biosynthesis protein TsaB|nr:tRNA (adenosine(37)-N6)-threonylcarbamoyltransferase complex dimerization subunit type 1 TsaB [Deltaproteobacteria bacterium]